KHQRARQNDEQAVQRVADATGQQDGAAQQFGGFDHMNARAPNHAYRFVQYEQQRKGEQQAIGDLALIHEAQHEAIDQNGQHRHPQGRDHERKPERHAQAIDAAEREVCAQHIQRTMREVDDVENAEDDIQTNRNNEQQQADIETVE